MDPEIAAVIRRLFEALNATNVALRAALAELADIQVRVTEAEWLAYRNHDRIQILEAARFRAEAPFLPPAEKMN